MKEEDMNQEKAETDIKTDITKTIEIIGGTTEMIETVDSEAEVIKKQDITKRKAIHSMSVIYRTTQPKK